MRYFSVILCLSSLFFVGCAHTQPEAPLLSPVDIRPGSTYEIGMYVLARGDTVAGVCRRFQIPISDFEALNPDFDKTHPSVGQRVKVYERLKQPSAIASIMRSGVGNTDTGIMHVVGSDFRSPKIERELKFYVANFSTYQTNHFYVGPTELDHGQLVKALVYWKEPRILMDYGELTDDAPEGTEIFAWQGHHLKLGRDTVDTGEDIGGSTYLETHRQWVDWMEQCISKGKQYVVTLDAATNAFPNTDRAKADNE